MTNAYEMFATDTMLESNGVTLDYGVFQITIARAGINNRKYLNLMSVMLKKHRRQIDTDSLGANLDRKLMVEVYADSIILGWTNMTGPDGNALPFNRENVIKLMTDLPDLYADIAEQANSAPNFRAKELEDSEKNLPVTSATLPASEPAQTG